MIEQLRGLWHAHRVQVCDGNLEVRDYNQVLSPDQDLITLPTASLTQVETFNSGEEGTSPGQVSKSLAEKRA